MYLCSYLLFLNFKQNAEVRLISYLEFSLWHHALLLAGLLKSAREAVIQLLQISEVTTDCLAIVTLSCTVRDTKHRTMAYHPNLGYESFKVTENGTIQYTAYEFLFVFHCNYGHSSVVSFARNSETFVDNRDFSYTFYITTPSLRKNGGKYFHAVFSFSKPSLIPGL